MSTTRYDIERVKSPYSGAKLLYISIAQSGTDWHSTPHAHACTELFYCLRGTGKFYIAGKYLNVVRDDLIILNPSVEHTEVSTSKNPLEYVVLGIEGIELFNTKNDQQFIKHNFYDKQDEVTLLIKMLMREIEAKDRWHETACCSLTEVLLIHIFKYIDSEVAPADGRDHKDCTLAKHYIDVHYANNITLDFLAELTHLNKYYLSHAFAREYHTSPISYLAERRIRESKYLLANTNHSLAQISGILGFASPGSFSRSFKRLEAILPIEYRKQCHVKKDNHL